MGYAEDVVKDYIRNNLTRFHDIRVKQLLDHLPCLTDADRQEIRAHENNNGNNSAVSELFERLRCRRAWVTQLITALEDNYSHLAEDIRQRYESAQVAPRRIPLPRPVAPPAASVSQPDVLQSLPSAPSSDYPPLSPPHSPSTPSRAKVSLRAHALTPAPSAPLQDVVDYRPPVQETKFASRSSETPIEAKALGNDVKPKVSTLGGHDRNSAHSSASLRLQPDRPADVSAATPESRVQPQRHLGGASREEMQSAKPVSSNTAKDNSVPNWDGSQQRPVCVKNGYFGNMNRSLDAGRSPAPTGPEQTAPFGLPDFSNQPEETSYLSSDSSPVAPRGQDGMQAEEMTIQALLGYQQEDLLGDATDNKPFLQQKHFDEEQKGALGQKDSSSDANKKKGDNRHSKQANSRTVDSGEMSNTAIPKGRASADFQRGDEAVPPSVPSETETDNSFEQDPSSSGSDEASHDHSLRSVAASGVGQLSEDSLASSSGSTVGLETRDIGGAALPPAAPLLGRSPSKSGQLPQRASKEHVNRVPNTGPVGRSQFPLSDFAGSSSVDVNPPSSPPFVSATWSDGYSDDLKQPVQERVPTGTNFLTTSESRPVDVPGNASAGATRVWSPHVTDAATNSREPKNKAKKHLGDIHIFHSNHEEEDLALHKPGVLLSENIVGWPLDQQLNSPGAEYSGTSDRLLISKGSDNLHLSNSTLDSNPEEKRTPPVVGLNSRRNVMVGTSDTSLRNDNRLDEGSLRTHTVHIEELPSVDLYGAPGITGPALRDARGSPRDFSASGDQQIKNAGSRPVCSDGQRNSLQDEDSSTAEACHMSDSTALVIGFALTSLVAVAFLLFRQLKK